MCDSGGGGSTLRSPTNKLTDEEYYDLQRKQSTEDYEFRNGFDPQSYKTDSERSEAEDRFNRRKNKTNTNNGPKRSTVTTNPAANKTITDIVNRVGVDASKQRKAKVSGGYSGTNRTSAGGVTNTASLGGAGGLLGG